MIAFRDTYETRKKEIEDFLNLMIFLENKENEKKDEISEFALFFYNGKDKIDLSFQALTNIFKSNVSLMIYNIIEYTVTNLIDSIYDEIRIKELSYIDVNESIRAIWRKTILKATNDPNSSINTLMKKTEEIIDGILNSSIIDIHARNSLPAGNMDGSTIKDTFETHGIKVKTNSSNYRPDILENIKTRRNNLAHGSVSFIEAVRMDTISDIASNERYVTGFLEELIISVNDYIDNKCYLMAK